MRRTNYIWIHMQDRSLKEREEKSGVTLCCTSDRSWWDLCSLRENFKPQEQLNLDQTAKEHAWFLICQWHPVLFFSSLASHGSVLRTVLQSQPVALLVGESDTGQQDLGWPHSSLNLAGSMAHLSSWYWLIAWATLRHLSIQRSPFILQLTFPHLSAFTSLVDQIGTINGKRKGEK